VLDTLPKYYEKSYTCRRVFSRGFMKFYEIKKKYIYIFDRESPTDSDGKPKGEASKELRNILPNS